MTVSLTSALNQQSKASTTERDSPAQTPRALIPHAKQWSFEPMLAAFDRSKLSALCFVENQLGRYHESAWASRWINIPRSNLEVNVFESQMNHLRATSDLGKNTSTPFEHMARDIRIPRSETGKTLRVGYSGFDTCTPLDENAPIKRNPFIDGLLNHVKTLPKNATVLEIGGGYGGLVKALLTERPDLSITSISADPNPIFRGLARLKENQRQQVEVITARVPDFDLSRLDKTFDLVIQNRFTHFLNQEDLEALTQQVVNTLSENGILALSQLATTNGSYRDKLGQSASIAAKEALPKQAYALSGNLYPRSQKQLNELISKQGLHTHVSSGYCAKGFDSNNRDAQFDNIFILARK